MLQTYSFSAFSMRLLSLKWCILDAEINNLKGKNKVSHRENNNNFISQWQVSTVVGRFVKQVFKKQWP